MKAILDGLRDGLVDFAESRASSDKAADLVLNGSVVETKLSVYGKVRIGILFLDVDMNFVIAFHTYPST